MISTELRGALVVHCVLAIHDEEIHRTHFWIRDHVRGRPALDRYLAGLPEIRSIQEYVPSEAARNDVPVVENESQREAVRAVMDLVLAQAERVAEGVARHERGAARRDVSRARSPARPNGRRSRQRAGSGRDDQDAAEEAAEGAMLAGLSELPVSATIVIGSDEGGVLPARCRRRRRGVRPRLDPLEVAGVARGGTGAMSMLAIGPPGSLMRLDMYMRRMAVGPRALGRIDLTRPVGENVATRRRSGATRTTSRPSCSNGRATTT